MRRRRSEAGFSLVEVLVTVVIIGITFAIFVGGMGTSFIVSDGHRKQAVAHAGIRNFAEAVKAAPFSTDCANLAAQYTAAYSPPPPTRRSSAGTAANATSHVAPGIARPTSNSTLLAFYAIAVGTSMDPPDGMTPGWALNSNNSLSTANRVSVLFADQAIAQATATGPRTARSTNAADSVAQLVALPKASTAEVSPTRRESPYSAATPASGAGSLLLRSSATTAVGDTMVAQVGVRGASTAVSPPPGWTLVNSKTHGTVASLLYERTATTAGAVDFVWNFSTVTDAAGGIVAYGGASANDYQATVTSVKFWDANLTPPAFSATCPPAESNYLQLISLRVVAPDQAATETIDVIKRCHNKPTVDSPCEDSL